MKNAMKKVIEYILSKEKKEICIGIILFIYLPTYLITFFYFSDLFKTTDFMKIAALNAGILVFFYVMQMIIYALIFTKKGRTVIELFYTPLVVLGINVYLIIISRIVTGNFSHVILFTTAISFGMLFFDIMKMMKSLLEVLKKYWPVICYSVMFFLVFSSWHTEQQTRNWNVIINVLMFVLGLFTTSFAIDGVLNKRLQLLLLKSNSLNEDQILKIVREQWDETGNDNIYFKVIKYKFPIWIFINVVMLVISAFWLRGKQFSNIYAYLNFIIFLYDFMLENIKSKRIEELLN